MTFNNNVIYLFICQSKFQKKKTCVSYIGFFEKTTPKSLYFEDFLRNCHILTIIFKKLPICSEIFMKMFTIGYEM
jgi:hypothetical protein